MNKKKKARQKPARLHNPRFGDEVIIAARQEGLSYGQYIARHFPPTPPKKTRAKRKTTDLCR